MTEKTCPHCQRPYTDDTKHGTAQCCGKTPCWEKTYWTAAEWEGQARMAAARPAETMTPNGSYTIERGGDQYTLRYRTFHMAPAEQSELDRLALAYVAQHHAKASAT